MVSSAVVVVLVVMGVEEEDGDFGFLEGAGEAEDAGVKKSSSEEIAPEDSSLSRFRGDDVADMPCRVDVCEVVMEEEEEERKEARGTRSNKIVAKIKIVNKYKSASQPGTLH